MRAEVVARMRRQQKQRERRQRLLIFGGSGLVLLVVIIGAAIAIINQRSSPSLTGLASFSEQSSHVTTPVKYPQTPPAGGNHNPVWLNCGIYDRPVANENAVHDLEHGAVWITYRPSLPAEQVQQLRSLVRGQTYLTLSPYPGLPAPVVASAWGKQVRLTSADDGRLTKFIQQFKQGPNAPEPGASCTGGTGTPIP